MRTPWLFFLLSVFSALPAFAATLTLGEALEEALANSPRLQRSESQREEAHWKKTEAYSGFLPSVSVSGNRLLQKKYTLTDITFGGANVSIPQILPTTIWSLNGQLPLFDGFASTNRYRAASVFAEAADRELDWAHFQLERDITNLYFRALGAKMLQLVAEQNVRTLDDHLKDVRLFRKAGVSTNYDVLRVEVQVSEARSELLNATDNVALAKDALGQALGKATEEREISGELPVLNAGLVSSISLPAADDRPDIAALENRRRGQDLSDSAAGLYLVPKIALFGQYQYYNNLNDRLWSSYRDAYQVGLSLNWNIFDGLTSFARSKQAVEQTVQAEKTLTMARLQTRQDFDLWKRKFLYFCSVYEARVDDVQKSTESVRLAREGRRVGARTNTDLLDAEAELHRAQAGAVNAQLGAIEALLHLESTVGKPIHRF